MTEGKINANKKQNMIPEILELADKGLKVFPTVNSNKKALLLRVGRKMRLMTIPRLLIGGMIIEIVI